MGPWHSGEPPLDPSPDEARSGLRRELLRPEYHDRDLLQEILDRVVRAFDETVGAASGIGLLGTLTATVAFVALVLALGWLLSRARSGARAAEPGPVLPDGPRLGASELRRRAEAALAEGRHGEAVVEGFRALAVRQVELGRLDDRPSATAREVAASLAAARPGQEAHCHALASLFDSVRYGDRPATHEDAVSVLALDDDLAGVR